MVGKEDLVDPASDGGMRKPGHQQLLDQSNG